MMGSTRVYKWHPYTRIVVGVPFVTFSLKLYAALNKAHRVAMERLHASFGDT